MHGSMNINLHFCLQLFLRTAICRKSVMFQALLLFRYWWRCLLSNSEAWNLYTTSPPLADKIIVITVTCAIVAAVLLREQRTGNMHHLSRVALYKHTSLIHRNNKRRPLAGKSFYTRGWKVLIKTNKISLKITNTKFHLQGLLTVSKPTAYVHQQV